MVKKCENCGCGEKQNKIYDAIQSVPEVNKLIFVTEEQYLAMQHLSILETNTLLSEKLRNDIRIILDMVKFGSDLIRIKATDN